MNKKIIKLIIVYNNDKLVNAYAKLVESGADDAGEFKAKEFVTQQMSPGAIQYVENFIASVPCTENVQELRSIYSFLPGKGSRYKCSVCGRILTGREIGYCFKHKIEPLKCKDCQHTKKGCL